MCTYPLPALPVVIWNHQLGDLHKREDPIRCHEQLLKSGGRLDKPENAACSEDV